MLVSFIISTFNRRDALLDTLAWIDRCGLAPEQFETLVVDNASPDGSADAVAEAHPHVRLFRQRENRGACAKNVGLPHARGAYVLFLDDDAYPRPGSVARMVRHFEGRPTLGAAVFTITLPSGGRECSAYPNVFIGCGTGFRRAALEQAGGLPEDFFMQAEEYDLSLRLLDAGWDVETFDDLHVTHHKTPRARSHWRTMRLDVRNNLLLAHRYFPDAWRWRMGRDWLTRYWRIAAKNGRRSAFVVGALQAMAKIVAGDARRPVSDETFERFARIGEIRAALADATLGCRRVVFVDLGKNVLPYYLAARALNLEVVAVADDKLAGGWYRGVPIVTDARALAMAFDAAVVSNSSRVHAAARREAWRRLTNRPVIDVLEPRRADLASRLAA